MTILLIDHFQLINGEAQFSGVTYHRMIKPHTVLKRNHNIEFTIINGINDEVTDELLNKHDLILFSRSIGNLEDIDGIVDRITKLSIPFGVDLDDHWILPKEHILYNAYKENKTSEAIYKSIQLAQFVIVTTPILADKVMQVNPNVHIIENGIDTQDEVWQPNKSESDRIRFGFTGGTTHINDVDKIAKSVVLSLKDAKFYNNAQVVLCGFEAKLNEPSIYVGYERMLTDNLNVLTDRSYINALRSLHRFDEPNQPYRRMWGLDVWNYANFYNDIDILVAPLESNDFNSCKSELKMLEAGFKGSAFMGHKTGPYSLLMTDDNSFDLNQNSFYIWQRLILQNPNLHKDKAAQLAEDVKRYDLKVLGEKRKELYNEIVK